MEDIGLRNTIIPNYQNKRIIIPNALISSQAVVNADHTERAVCQWIEIGIAYHANIELAKAIMREEVMKHPLFVDSRSKKQERAGDDPAPVRVIDLGDFAISLRAWAWAATSSNASIMQYDLLESIKKRFDIEGIEIPYPYQNSVLQNVPNQPMIEGLIQRDEATEKKNP